MKQELRVVHAQGDTVFDTDAFSVDDRTSPGVLVVKHRETGEPVAAFNREFWICAELLDVKGEGDGESEVRSTPERAVRGS